MQLAFLRICLSGRDSGVRSSGFKILPISAGIRKASTMSNRAVVLAGGMGTRLRPYTVVLPKPLMPVGEYPILEIITRQLARFNFSHITLAVNHQAEIIKAFFNNGSKW